MDRWWHRRQLPVFLGFVGLGAVLSITLIMVYTRSIPLTSHQLVGPLNSAVTVMPVALPGVSKLPKLLSNDDKEERWTIVGGALLQAGFVRASIPALRRAVAADQDNMMLRVALGEAMAMSDNGWISEPARVEFESAIKADPNDLIARFYMAHWLLQTGKAKQALVKWVGLMRTVGEDKVWYDRLWAVMPEAADRLGISKLALKALCSAGM